MDAELREAVGHRYTIAEMIGSGGAADVYRVSQIGLGVDRALKVLKAGHDDARLPFFEKTFTDEIRLLSNLTHRNIVKIIDYIPPQPPANVRCFVMEYVNGGTLSNFAANSECAAEHLTQLFGEVLEGLTYLHSQNVLHADIKPSNILISRDVRLGSVEAKITDLGVAKVLFDPERAQASFGGDETFLWGSPRYVPQYAAAWVNKRVPISKALLEGYLHHLDLYTFGATIAETLSTLSIKGSISLELNTLLSNPKPHIRSRFDADSWDYLTSYVRRLVVERPADGFSTTDEAREAFNRLDPQRAIPWRVPEIATLGSRRYIAQGNQIVRLSARANAIVSHPCFQRLRRLNQLNFVELIYPGARHSRMSHSFAAFELAKEVTSHLLADTNFRLVFTHEDISAFLLAALLHDIGHYPLAHALEDLRDVDPKAAAKPDFDMASHFIYERRWSQRGSLGEEIDRSWRVSQSTLLRLLSKRPPKNITPVETIARSLLDGAVDVDKLAYLRQDSAYTGVTYGAGIDAAALISALVVLVPGKHRGSALTQSCVGLRDKGVSPAESLIAARYHMFSRVYWHHTNRAVMSMIQYAARRVLDSNTYSFESYIDDTLDLSDTEALRSLSNQYDALTGTRYGEEENPLHGIVDGSRSLYKRLLSFGRSKTRPVTDQAHTFLASAPSAVLLNIRSQIKELLATAIGETTIPDSWVIFDVPRVNKAYDAMKDVLVLLQNQQDVERLRDISSLIGAVFEDFQALVKKSRIFVHPRLRQYLRERGIEDQVVADAEEIVHSQAAQ